MDENGRWRDAMLKDGLDAKVVFSGDARQFGERDGANAADMIAKFPSGAKWAVRICRTRGGSRKDDAQFNPAIRGATAVIARVSRAGVEFFSARTGRKMTPPSHA